jgi:glycosyltransferase involved in cell wall biosynthesis
MNKPSATIIGTLPPIKGLSPYCQELVNSLSKNVEIEFIGFKKLYPDFLYPGGTKFTDANYRIVEQSNVHIRNLLTYYNPFSWLWAGLTIHGKIVHAQWWSHVLAPIYFVMLLICKARGKKIIITVHNVLPHEKSHLSTFLNRLILSLGDKFIVHNKKNKEAILDNYRIPESKVSIIPHGVLTPVPVKGISKEEARKYLGIPQDEKVILNFGNIRDYKGLDILLQTLAMIKEQIKNVKFIIAGECWGSFKKYDEIIRANELEDYIVKRLCFIPPSEVEYYFSASDAVVLPYKYFDSQSGAGALALPFNKPLVVTNVGGLPDFVRDERAVATANDPRDLANKLICILSDEGLLAKLGKDSQDIAREYGWDEIAKKTIQVYSGQGEYAA